MGRSTLEIDVFNPGQVLACYGLMELAVARCSSGVRAAFDWSTPGAGRFLLDVPDETDPAQAGFEFVARAEVEILHPRDAAVGSEIKDRKLRVAAVDLADGFPMPCPEKPAALPARLSDGETTVVIDHWVDRTRRDNVKFWAGSGGYPGSALIRDALQAIREMDEATAAVHPLDRSAPRSSSLRLDWRGDYVPMEIGFSLNKHSHIAPQGYPFVEVLAAIGLSHARPDRPDRRDKLLYRYTILGGALVPPALIRAALGGAPLPYSQRKFRILMDWPGQEGQARCITQVIEES